jgi:tRNA(adenine34) deaminase
MGAGLSDDEAMGLALDAARQAAAEGEVPVGAVLLRDGRPLAVAGNRREADRDPTAHAEILVLRQAADLIGSWRLDGTELVVTLEPCAMCAGALVAARVSRLVFGAMDERFGAVGSRYNLLSDPRLNHEVAQASGVRGGESSDLLRSFFAERR